MGAEGLGRDSGLLHVLLGLARGRDIRSHPNAGASWEGFAIEQAIERVRADAADCWRTRTGAELDLSRTAWTRRRGVEVTFQAAPPLTPSVRHALADLHVDHLTVVCPADRPYALDRRVTVVPLSRPAPDPRTLTPTVPGRRSRRGGGAAPTAGVP